MDRRTSKSSSNYSPELVKSTPDNFFLLLWKNYTLHKRHKINLTAELLLPILLSLLLIAVRAATPPIETVQPTVFNPVSVIQLPLHAHTIIQSDKLPVVYSPDVPVVNEVVEKVATTFSAKIQKFGFSSEQEMENYIKQNADIDFLAGVVFENMQGNSFPKDIRYKIRLKTKLRANSNNPMSRAEGWLTQQMYPMFPQPGPRSENDYGPSPNYYAEGFVTIQHAVAMAVISILVKKLNRQTVFEELSVPNITLQLFPVPAFRQDEFIKALQTWLPVIIMLSYLFSSINIIKSLVQEKENKIKESLKMMGLTGFLHWAAWYIKSLLGLLIPIIIMTILLTISFSEEISVIAYTDPFIIFCFLLLYICTSIMFCFAVSVFFSRASSAVTAAGLVYFFSYVPYMYIQPRYTLLDFGWKLVFCILPNTAMAFGGQFITMYEGSGVGLQWSNLNKGATPDDSFSMGWVFFMLIFDWFFYFLITWYVDNVYPGDFGVPKPWYFPISKNYWGSNVPVREIVLAIEDKGNDVHSAISNHFEQEPVNLQAGIHIKNLTKVFGNKVVVNSVSLKMYQDQITVLLGHNGAGKTTTMSMLTGLITPSKGTALVYGYDIRREMTAVRSSLGLCPQHDILFPELTVEEHLQFFYRLKGAEKGNRDFEVNQVISMLSMRDKRTTQVAHLSAGMRRKLSVGIALIGGSKVVLLDEPTSGMDPAARRETWELLQKERFGRTILLTTHFMDEADILGDRVAIMVSGQVRCCGSPLYLKKFYGAGFHMVVVKDPSCNVDELSHVIKSIVSKSKLSRHVGSELTYLLPQENISLFASLFEILETQKEELGVASFGISMTTMEDVFFTVGEVSVLAKRKARLSDHDTSVTDEHHYRNGQILETTAFKTTNDSGFLLTNFRSNKGVILVIQQLRALFVKRLIHSRRNYGLLFIQMAFPMIFVSIALILAKTAPKAEDEPPLEVTLDLFPETVIPFYVNTSDDSEHSFIANAYASQITKKNKLKYTYNKDISKFLLEEALDNPTDLRYKFTVGVSFSNTTEGTAINAYYGDEAYHSAPVSVGLVDTSLLRHYMGSSDYSFTVINHPLPTTLISQGQSTSIGFDVAFNLVFGASLLASSFVIFIIKERQTKAKHLQFISGINTISFWLSSFIWDYLNFLIPCFGILLLFRIFQQTEYVNLAMQGRFIVVFLVYGWSVIPLMYLLSFLFNESATGFTNLLIFNAFTGMGTFVASIMLYLPELKISDTADTLQWFFLPLPNYSLAWAFFNLYKNYVAYESCSTAPARQMCASEVSHPCCKETGNCGIDGCLIYTSEFFDWSVPGIGRPIFFMQITGCISIVILLLLEFRFFIAVKWIFKSLPSKKLHSVEEVYIYQQKKDRGDEEGPPPDHDEDGDVARERFRIETTPISDLVHTDSVVMKQLTKYYGKFLAVDNISIGIARGECFGLLGTTGAGKTTVFNMLTGDIQITKGEAYLEGYSVIKDIKKVQQHVGYCPQFDAIIDQMTGRETLTMFARLRGIPEKNIPTLVETLATKLMFKDHIDKQAKNYSGGNRRKLSTAVAMVGSPLIVFLDEPTTGVDPVSRRMLWDGLSKLRETGCSITLTTHSMEECEALCTRLAIMKKGRFLCLGSPQHLKSKFGCSYTLIAKVQQLSDRHTTSQNIELLNSVARLCDFINKKFTGSELKEIHQGMVYYVIENPKLSLASIFSTMEDIKKEFNLEDYSISQTTLEDVFLNFIKETAPTPATEKSQRISFIQSIPELADKLSDSGSSSTLEIAGSNFQSLPFLTDVTSDNEIKSNT